MNVKFLSPARDELKLAIAFYEKSSVGLGSRFLNEVKDPMLANCQKSASMGSFG